MPSDDDLRYRMEASVTGGPPLPDFADRLTSDVKARHRRRALLAPTVTALAVLAVAGGLALPSGPSAREVAADKPIIETAPPTPGPSRTACPARGGMRMPRNPSASTAPATAPALLPPATATLSRVEADGALTWRRYVPVDDNQSPDTAPLVIGQQTIALAGGTLRSYDLNTGAERWAVPAVGAPYGLWKGDGTVVALLDQVSDRGRIVGFDAEDGSVRWEHSLPGNGLLGEQVLAPDGSLVVVLTTGRVQVLDTASGQIRWTADAPGGPRTAVVNDVVLQPGGGQLVARRLGDGQVAWRAGKVDDQVEPTGAGDVVLTAPTSQGIGIDTGVHAFDAATGGPLWSRTSSSRDQALRISAASSNALLVADDYFAAPTLTSLDPRSGAVRWSVPARTVYGLRAVIGERALVVLERRDEKYALARRDLRTGELTDETPATSEQQPLALPQDRVLVPSFVPGVDDGASATTSLKALSLATGDVLFTAEEPHVAPRITALPAGAVLLQGSDQVSTFCLF